MEGLGEEKPAGKLTEQWRENFYYLQILKSIDVLYHFLSGRQIWREIPETTVPGRHFLCSRGLEQPSAMGQGKPRQFPQGLLDCHQCHYHYEFSLKEVGWLWM
jgi:hypothetical protein